MIPTTTCNFKISFDVKHEAGHYLKVKFDWIHVDPTTKEITYPVIDTGFLKDWTLVQIEGESPVPEEDELASSPNK